MHRANLPWIGAKLLASRKGRRLGAEDGGVGWHWVGVLQNVLDNALLEGGVPAGSFKVGALENAVDSSGILPSERGVSGTLWWKC